MTTTTAYIVEGTMGRIIFNGTRQEALDLARMHPGSSWGTVAEWKACGAL